MKRTTDKLRAVFYHSRAGASAALVLVVATARPREAFSGIIISSATNELQLEVVPLQP